MLPVKRKQFIFPQGTSCQVILSHVIRHGHRATRHLFQGRESDSLLWSTLQTQQSFPGGASGKEPAYQYRRHKRRGFNPCIRKIPRRRAWQPTPVFLPGESHGQRSLTGYSPKGCKELDMTEATQHACTNAHRLNNPREQHEGGLTECFCKSKLCRGCG